MLASLIPGTMPLSPVFLGDLTDRGKDLISRQKGQFSAAIEAGKQGYREAKKSDQGKVSAAVEES